MTFSKFTDIKNLDKLVLEKELTTSKKMLFELRLKKATRQSFKPHLFKSLKKKIAQILTLQSQQLQTLQ